MRALARRLSTIASALSLLLCLAVCVMWVGSYPHASEPVETEFVHARSAQTRGGGWVVHVRTEPGTVGLFAVRESDDVMLGFVGGPMLAFLAAFAGGASPADGYAYVTGPTMWGIIAPAAAWLAAAAVLPGLRLASLVTGALGRPWRRRRGLCLRCGYDLRASPERCPECGAAAGTGPVEAMTPRQRAAAGGAADG